MMSVILLLIYLLLFVVLFAVLFIKLMLLPLAAYLLRGYAIYKVAQRRQMKRAWLAFIPVANDYMLGTISDEYQAVAHGKNTKNKIILPCLSGATILTSMNLVSAARAVWYYLTLRDFFDSCEPRRSDLYFVLSVVIGAAFGLPADAVLMLCCMKKDDGMPL